ncbi:MAG: FAD-binding oxidoreductase [Tagaea sp.]
MNLALFRELIGDVPVVDDPVSLKLKSRDFFWFSPILREELGALQADLIVSPRDESDLLTIARAAVKARVPLTPRGGGTGNYGQAMPMAGGALVDFARLDGLKFVTPGRMRALAGTRIASLDRQLRDAHGVELRLHPSTARTSTLGGYIAGGSGGIGSIQWGMLRDRGNVAGIRVVTLSDEPTIVDLEGDDVQQANHAYGTNGLILSVDMPTTQAAAWREMVLSFPDVVAATRFGLALAASDGLAKKLASVVHPELAKNFKPIRAACPTGKWIVLALVAEFSHAGLRDLAAEHGAKIELDRSADESPGEPPLYEYSWGHTTLHTIRVDKSVTYLQSMFPAANTLDLVAGIEKATGGELLHHFECVRYDGKVTVQGVPVFRWESREQLDRLVKAHEALGIRIANPHTWILQNGGMKKIDAAQVAFRERHDPYGLSNPGKMAGWNTGPALKALGGGAVELETTGWV